ncbi:MAG: hypothetical protein DRJ57_02595, partial [Thermoprotei archaeon]
CIGTWGEGWGRYADFGFRVICLTDERNLELVEEAMEEAGEVFNEVLIDDFWANWCTCQHCVKRFSEEYGLNVTPELLRAEFRRGASPLAALWARFSVRLLLDVSRRYVVEPFRRRNPGARVVLKVAEWREDFYVRGLLIPALREVFDGVYVGTESRELTHRYGSYYNARLVAALAEGFDGAWFDTYDGLGYAFPATPETYVEQLVASAASLPPEITLFNLEDLLRPSRELHVRALEEHLPAVREFLRRVSGEPTGVLRPALLPCYSPVRDRYLEDYLGSIGLPLKPVAPHEMGEDDYVLITGKEVELLDLEDLMRRVGTLILTADALEVIASSHARIAELLGLEEVERREAWATTFRYGDRWAWEGHRKAVRLPVGPIIRCKGAEPVVWAGDGTEEWPVILRRRSGGLDVVMVCVTRCPSLLSEYPELVRQALRDVAAEYTGVRVAARVGPLSNVSVHLYSDGHLLVVNHNPHSLVVEVMVDYDRASFSGRPQLIGGRARLRELAENAFLLELPGRSYGMVEYTQSGEG